MLDPAFLEAWTHRPGGHTVLGRKLHPLCALDFLTLEAVNSPFLYDKAEVHREDLIFAVWLLSNPPPDDLTVSNLELDESGKEWLKKVAETIDLERDCTLVQNYVADYYSPPDMFRQASETPLTALGSPWILTMVTMVVNRLHIPLRDAWTMGIGQLFWYRCSLEEQETESRVISPELREEMKKAETGSKTYTLQIGETLEQFSKRTGISEADAAVLLHNQSSKR